MGSNLASLHGSTGRPRGKKKPKNICTKSVFTQLFLSDCCWQATYWFAIVSCLPPLESILPSPVFSNLGISPMSSWLTTVQRTLIVDILLSGCRAERSELWHLRDCLALCYKKAFSTEELGTHAYTPSSYAQSLQSWPLCSNKAPEWQALNPGIFTLRQEYGWVN